MLLAPKKTQTAIAFCISPREEFRYCCTRGLLVFLKTISILPREQPKSSAGLLEIFSEFHFHVVCCAGPDNRRDIDSSAHTHTGNHIMQVQGMVSKFPVKMCYNFKFLQSKMGKRKTHRAKNANFLSSFLYAFVGESECLEISIFAEEKKTNKKLQRLSREVPTLSSLSYRESLAFRCNNGASRISQHRKKTTTEKLS